jgi:hypothetical protein
MDDVHLHPLLPAVLPMTLTEVLLLFGGVCVLWLAVLWVRACR